MMSYLHTKFHDNWISSFRGFWDGRTDGRTDGRSDCTPRPAIAFRDAGNKNVMHTVGHKIKVEMFTNKKNTVCFLLI